MFSLQFLLMIDFKNSDLSKKNRDGDSSIYLGGYMSVQMMCDILRGCECVYRTEV